MPSMILNYAHPEGDPHGHCLYPDCSVELEPTTEAVLIHIRDDHRPGFSRRGDTLPPGWTRYTLDEWEAKLGA